MDVTPSTASGPSGLPITVNDGRITVKIDGAERAILDQAKVHLAPRQFVGILGASGSGKSTLIKTFAGLMELTEGEVRLAGEVCSSEQLRHDRRIAYLPQDVVIHEELTPRRALGAIARLKGLAGRGAMREAIDGAAAKTGVADRLDVPIRRLSGGQRKRVALAGELLGDPGVILLDEATSGLDPASEAEMMKLFRSLADEGRTVVCITHFPDRLELCDRLIYLKEGRVVFDGTPGRLRGFFGTGSIEEVYLAQDLQTTEEWIESFEESEDGLKHRKVQKAALALSAAGSGAVHSSVGSFSQFRTMLGRYVRLQMADWLNLLLLFAQAPVIGLMIGLTYGDIRADFAELHASRSKEVMFLLVIAVLWCAGTAAVREIVKERRIFLHETRFGVRVLPYLFSKLTLLSGLVLAQAALLLVVVRRVTGFTGDASPQFAVLGLTAIAGLTLGLLVSAVSRSSEQSMTILPVLLIMQAIFSGGLAKLAGIVEYLSRALIPAWWSLDGLRSTLSSDLRTASYPSAPGHFQEPILGAGGPLALDLAMLAGHAVLWLMICRFVIQRQLRRSTG